MPELDYLACVRRESGRFRHCLASADPAAHVPSCPGWTATDLLWHLTEVQTFWATIVRDRLQESAEQGPVRPDTDYQGLLAGFIDANQALAGASDDVHVWTWADDQSMGFIRRRQAHEALIHRLDAELTAGTITPLDPVLATDGVDEALTLMYGGYPAWATYTPTGTGGRVVTTDTGSSWNLTTGRFAGTSPNSGNTHDDPTIEINDAAAPVAPAFTISGPAADLDAWLWRRPGFAEPVIAGDQKAAAEFLAVIAAGVQ